jgi:acyl dehydratase
MPGLENLQIGQEIPPVSKGPITRQHLVEWCAAENDYYPLHYDERVAAAMNLAGTPIQGTYKYALMGQAVERWLGNEGTLQRLSARYRGLNLEGEVIIARGRISHIETDGRVTLEGGAESASCSRTTEGSAVVALPTTSSPAT